MRKLFGKVALGVLGVYLLSLIIMIPYYNWKHVKEHGFLRWLAFGEVVATAKGIAWPYFALVARPDTPGMSADQRHYLSSKDASNEAIDVIANAGDLQSLNAEQRSRVMELLRRAIEEAGKVQPAFLRKVHPEMPHLYETKYKASIELLERGLRTNNMTMMTAGGNAYNEFAAWVHAHEKELVF
ncbi:MAG: hypothetical protein HY900_38280 [Deltaproteobacteria bacterium]|nr:hypothetical protein [Deltaproteobacteria bacterium]